MKFSIIVYACVIAALTILIPIHNYTQDQYTFNNFSHLYHRSLQTVVEGNLDNQATIEQNFKNLIDGHLPKHSQYTIEVLGYRMYPKALRVRFNIKFKNKKYKFDQPIVEEIKNEKKD